MRNRFAFAIGFGWFLLLPCFPLLASQSPEESLTPGVLCSSSDPDFDKFYYAEQVARCTRNIATAEKQAVADSYGGIPKSQWSHYEFDHLIPLCAGGGNDQGNLWPQPIAEAKEKDKLENHICGQMRAGKMLQREAVQQVHDWFAARKAN